MTALLPYAGTSGHSGSLTSRERANAEDTAGTTGQRQRNVIKLLHAQRERGVTWRDVSAWLNLHHGQASSALSILHKEGIAARLAATRDRCAIYVLPEHVNGRATNPYGKPPKTCPHCGGAL